MTDYDYCDCDEEGQDLSRFKRAKWTIPTTEFQREFLGAVGRKYYGEKTERSAVIRIENAMAPFELNPDRPPKYPTQFIEDVMEWAKKSRRSGVPITLSKLITACNNDKNRQEFIDREIAKGRKKITAIAMTDHKLEVINDGSTD